jgi:hypothetical protein
MSIRTRTGDGLAGQPAIEPMNWITSRAQTLGDGLFLGLVVLTSVALYVTRLGFYTDDWVFLQLLRAAPDQSLAGLIRALYAGDIVIRQRPMQMLDLAILYRIFGSHPAGYHWVNAAVLVCVALLLYLSLRELGQPRVIALAVAVLYGLSPNYATDRFWIAAFQAPLSIAFYLLSLYADLKALPANGAGRWSWRFLSMLCVIGSGMAYEVALPLFLLNPILVGYIARQRRARLNSSAPTAAGWLLFWTPSALAFALVIGYKLLVTVRLGVPGSYWTHLLDLVIGAPRVNFGTYGLGLPLVLLWIFRHAPPWPSLALGGGLGLAIGGYLAWTARQTAVSWPSPKAWLTLVGVGVVVFGLGYAIFLVNADVWFTSASVGNRTAIAAALGVALTFAGGLGLVCSWLPSQRVRWPCFCGLAALLSVSGFLIINTLGDFWDDAYDQELAIVDDVRVHVPSLPAGSTLILDGVCLEHGGAYIFTGHRDLAAVLQTIYHDDSIWATAITHTPQLGPGGLTILTQTDYADYAYGDKLLVYQYSQKKIYDLTDAEAARQYQAASQFVPERDCPPGFAWGVNE